MRVQGTFYGSGADAASWCKGNGKLNGYPGLPTVALNSVQFDYKGSWCGKCLQVSPLGCFAEPCESICFASYA